MYHAKKVLTVLALATSFAAATFHVAVDSSVTVAINAAGTPSPQPTATQPALSLVKNVCLTSTNDLQLDAFAYSNGYLLCITSDANTGGQQVYKETSPGNFTFVKGAGGIYGANDLVTFAHVPLATAQVLVNLMASQLAPRPSPTPTHT